MDLYCLTYLAGLYSFTALAGLFFFYGFYLIATRHKAASPLLTPALNALRGWCVPIIGMEKTLKQASEMYLKESHQRVVTGLFSLFVSFVLLGFVLLLRLSYYLYIS